MDGIEIRIDGPPSGGSGIERSGTIPEIEIGIVKMGGDRDMKQTRQTKLPLT